MTVSKKEQSLLRSLSRQGLTLDDLALMAKAAKQGNPDKDRRSYRVGRNKACFGYLTDTHIGNVNYDPALMTHAAKMFDKEGVDFVLHSGDIVDGWYQNRPQAVFEQNAIGLDQQVELAVKELSKINQPLYFITGNHEYNTFVRGAGVEVGKILEDKLRENGRDVEFLGNAEADVVLKGGATIKMIHPDGGSSYAISYKSQKLIESFGGGEKPAVLLIGHFHKAEYLFYRNVHCLQGGTLCGQTKFMRGKSLQAMKGFYIVDVASSNGGQIDRFTPSFYPAYD